MTIKLYDNIRSTPVRFASLTITVILVPVEVGEERDVYNCKVILRNRVKVEVKPW